MTTLQIILGIISTIVIALGTNAIKEFFAYKKYIAEIKKVDDKLEESKKTELERSEKQKEWYDQRMSSMENKFGELSTLVRSHITDSNFEINFKNDFQNFVRNICRSNPTMEMDYINAFQTWANYIEGYALNFYKDNYRTSTKDEFTKQKLANNLSDDMNKLINSFQNYVHLSEIGGVKVWNDKEFTFGKFIKDDKRINLQSSSLALVQILEQNGLDTYHKFLSVFTNYINRWFANFATALQIWEGIRKN